MKGALDVLGVIRSSSRTCLELLMTTVISRHTSASASASLSSPFIPLPSSSLIILCVSISLSHFGVSFGFRMGSWAHTQSFIFPLPPFISTSCWTSSFPVLLRFHYASEIWNLKQDQPCFSSIYLSFQIWLISHLSPLCHFPTEPFKCRSVQSDNKCKIRLQSGAMPAESDAILNTLNGVARCRGGRIWLTENYLMMHDVMCFFSSDGSCSWWDWWVMIFHPNVCGTLQWGKALLPVQCTAGNKMEVLHCQYIFLPHKTGL